ncbi:UNVERIFIED_CONTAM: 5-formyltetrahydrofolate cyclo-ligase [Acetivibrio alkalicellulosi]
MHKIKSLRNIGDILKEKKDIRKKILSLRNDLSGEHVLKNSEVITNSLVELKEFKQSKNIMAYMNFRNEVSTFFLLKSCFEMGKKVILPAINTVSGKKKIVTYEVKDMEQQLKKGTYGILEPVNDMDFRVDIREINMIIVPGVAFDTNRNRIGYGAGYYDVFLRELKEGCYKVGIAFELQICYHIPVEKHDVPLDIIVTEKRVI